MYAQRFEMRILGTKRIQLRLENEALVTCAIDISVAIWFRYDSFFIITVDFLSFF